MTAVIHAVGLCKAYGSVKAVTDLDLNVEPGEIYAFLGLNGAGKTTTIRMLLGLIRPTIGSVMLFGEPVGSGGRGPWGRVGHLVESPTAYAELSVRENLDVARRLHGLRDRGVVDRIVARMGLDPYAGRAAGTLSLGNLQRLGLARALLHSPELLARALLHSPELLILDEPANGLDPAGVVEVRELLAGLARDEGVTVFMSSHILAEVAHRHHPSGSPDSGVCRGRARKPARASARGRSARSRSCADRADRGRLCGDGSRRSALGDRGRAPGRPGSGRDRAPRIGSRPCS